MQYNSFTNTQPTQPTVPFNPDSIVTENKIYITGTLVNSNVSLVAEGTIAKNGKPQKACIKGDITIRCTIGDNVSEHKVEIYKKKKTNAGAENKGYAPLLVLMEQDSIGKRFAISAQFQDSKFLDHNTGVLIQNSKIKANFVNFAKEDAVDQANITFGGFVYQGLTDKFNKQGECYAKELYIMQSGDYYSGKPHINLVKFMVDPEDPNAFPIQSTYTKGQTIIIDAQLRSRTEEKKVESADRMFGAPQVKVYTNTIRSNYIVGGTDLINIEGQTYTPDDIQFLVAAYEDSTAELMAKNDKGAKKPATSPATSASRTLF